MLLGAGAMAERLAKEINIVGARSVTVANRTQVKAQALADQYGWKSASLSDLGSLLASVDVVICAISSDQPVITAELIGDHSVTIVDLGVPSTVSVSEANSLARVVNIELLAEACAANSELRASAVIEADKIIDVEVEEFSRECSERDVAPAITALVSLGEHVRKENLRWAMSQLEELNAHEKKVVEDLAFRLMRGMLQGQIAAMKSDSLSLQEKACLASVFKDLCPEAAAH